MSYVTCHVPCVTCHASHVTCQVSHVMCRMSQDFFISFNFLHYFFFLTICWSFLVEGLLSTGPTPSSSSSKASTHFKGIVIPYSILECRVSLDFERNEDNVSFYWDQFGRDRRGVTVALLVLCGRGTRRPDTFGRPGPLPCSNSALWPIRVTGPTPPPTPPIPDSTSPTSHQSTGSSYDHHHSQVHPVCRPLRQLPHRLRHRQANHLSRLLRLPGSPCLAVQSAHPRIAMVRAEPRPQLKKEAPVFLPSRKQLWIIPDPTLATLHRSPRHFS